MPPRIPILLLKTRSSPHDGYDDFFKQDYDPSFIPVLEHRFNTEKLTQVRNLFANHAFELEKANENHNSKDDTTENPRKYGGMIFTSQRAVEGFADMISQHGLPIDINSSSPILYTVGPATARSLTTLRDQHLPTSQIYGADAGNGENLAHMILKHYNSIHTPASYVHKPALLFLVGEQRRDIIPKTLMADSLPSHDRVLVDEIVVYETGEMDSFERDFEDSVRRYTDEEEVWVVVFSPSGCEAMLRVLKLGPFADKNGDKSGDERRVFVATIGPTTRDHLRNQFGFEPDVCAEKPSPEGVAEGIARFRESRGSA